MTHTSPSVCWQMLRVLKQDAEKLLLAAALSLRQATAGPVRSSLPLCGSCVGVSEVKLMEDCARMKW